MAPAGAELVALMGDGSFRDTLGILQKVLTISEDAKLTEEEVARVVGAPAAQTVNEFFKGCGRQGRRRGRGKIPCRA